MPAATMPKALALCGRSNKCLVLPEAQEADRAPETALERKAAPAETAESVLASVAPKANR